MPSGNQASGDDAAAGGRGPVGRPARVRLRRQRDRRASPPPGSRPRPRSAASRRPATGATTWPPWTSSPATTTWTPPASSGTSPRSSSTSTPTSSRSRPPSAGLVSDEFTDLPSGLDDEVRELALEVTADATVPVREGGGAAELVPRATAASPTTTAPRPSNGADDLLPFLARGPGRPHRLLRAVRRLDGRDGPDPRHPGPGRGRLPPARPGRARTPTSTAPTTCTPGPSSTSPGAGWVRFEPTPAWPRRDRARLHHAADQPRRTPTRRPTRPSEDIAGPDRPAPPPRPRPPQDEEAGRRRRRVGRPVAAVLLAVLVVLALLVLLVLTPRAVRRRRRAARLGGRSGGRLGRAARHGARPRDGSGRASAHRGRPPTSWCAGSARRPTSTPPSGRVAGPRSTRTPSTRSTGSSWPWS